MHKYIVKFAQILEIYKQFAGYRVDDDSGKSKEEQAIELLKGLTSEQIMVVISATNK